jgi:hypothetical protein
MREAARRIRGLIAASGAAATYRSSAESCVHPAPTGGGVTVRMCAHPLTALSPYSRTPETLTELRPSGGVRPLRGPVPAELSAWVRRKPSDGSCSLSDKAAAGVRDQTDFLAGLGPDVVNEILELWPSVRCRQVSPVCRWFRSSRG